MKVVFSLMALVLTAVFAVSGQAASAKKWYWTEQHADAVVASQKTRIRSFQPQTPTIWADAADCRGVDELGSSFMFNRFSCEVTVYYQTRGGGISSPGTYATTYRAPLLVWIIGPNTYHWKMVGNWVASDATFTPSP